ncbi:MAG: hypothetical protein ABW061_12365, partial [Polyangiaceae bacterium]
MRALARDAASQHRGGDLGDVERGQPVGHAVFPNQRFIVDLPGAIQLDDLCERVRLLSIVQEADDVRRLDRGSGARRFLRAS